MDKPRHIQTIPCKYGVGVDYTKECKAIMDSVKFGHNLEETMDTFPYIGYLYVPIKLDWVHSHEPWWIDTKDGGMLRSKVLAVSDTSITYAQWDSHHREIHFIKRSHQGYAVQGNVLVNINTIKGTTDGN